MTISPNIQLSPNFITNSPVFNIVSQCTLQHTEITHPVTGRAS